MHTHCRLAPRFGASRMWMASQRDVLCRGGELHGHAVFTDQLAHARTDHVHAKNLVGIGVGEDLHETFGLVVDLRPAVGSEGKLAHLVGTSLCLQLLLALADTGHLWSRVDHTWNHSVVDLRLMPSDAFDTGHSLVFSLVGEHRTGGDVTNDPHTGYAALVFFVAQHAALVGAQPDVLQPQPVGIGTPADS